jgi:hypothetical protein
MRGECLCKIHLNMNGELIYIKMINSTNKTHIRHKGIYLVWVEGKW